MESPFMPLVILSPAPLSTPFSLVIKMCASRISQFVLAMKFDDELLDESRSSCLRRWESDLLRFMTLDLFRDWWGSTSEFCEMFAFPTSLTREAEELWCSSFRFATLPIGKTSCSSMNSTSCFLLTYFTSMVIPSLCRNPAAPYTVQGARLNHYRDASSFWLACHRRDI